MSIIQQHTSASLSDAWRTIDIDALTEDSSRNFDTSSLHPPLPETSESEVRQLAGQVRQLLRGGDAEGALRGCLEFPVYNGNDLAKVSCIRAFLAGISRAVADDGVVCRKHISRPSLRCSSRSRRAR
jgi:actin related protein 2/3 complex subunit 5